jgi:hypothetical protein
MSAIQVIMEMKIKNASYREIPQNAMIAAFVALV